MTLERKRPFHEAWARAVEQYVMDGRSPSVALRPVMRRISHWLRMIYRPMLHLMRPQCSHPSPAQAPARIDEPRAGPDPQAPGGCAQTPCDGPVLNVRLRRVLDRMLATDRQLRQAERVHADGGGGPHDEGLHDDDHHEPSCGSRPRMA